MKALLAVALVGVGLAAGAEPPVDRFTAAQVSQVASEAALKLQVVQVAQNQRIIELLEQMAKPRP